MTDKLFHGKRPRWSKIYDLFFPDFTCPASRHVKVMSEQFRSQKSDLREAVAGYDPDHMAGSLEVTVIMLWEARKLLDEAGYDRVEVDGQWVWRRRDAAGASAQPAPARPEALR